MAFNAANQFDVAYVADCATLRHGTECIIDEIASHFFAGYTTAIVPIPGDTGTDCYSISERMRRCCDRGWARVIDPRTETLSATLAIFPTPSQFPKIETLPTAFLRVEFALIVVDGSLWTPSGRIRPAIERFAAWVKAMDSGDSEWVATCKDTQSKLELSTCVTATGKETWEPIVYPSHWTPQNRLTSEETPVLGRYAIPSPDALPRTLEELLSFYPLSGHVRVHLVGAQEHTLRMLVGRPRHWSLFPYGSISVRRFLRRIDFFVECGPLDQTPVAKANVLGAMATAVVPVLPTNSASSFDDVVLAYDEPAAILEKTLGLYRVKDSYRAQAERCRQFAFDNHGPSVHLERLQRLIGVPRLPTPLPGRPAPVAETAEAERASLLLVTSNGIGVGHLTRMLAIAKRLPSPCLPVFATMSPTVSIVRKEGFHAEYVPFHAYAKCNPSDWNRWLHAELSRLIRFFGVRVVVFDGHYPFDGLCRALSCDPGIVALWCRRAMWPRALWDEVIDRAKFFDLVIEPGELAAASDVGATVPYRQEAQKVDPITLLDERDLLSREDAQRTLGLDGRRTNVLLQLSSGNHINIVPVIGQILSILDRIGDFDVTIAQWPNAEYNLDQWRGVRRLVAYPHAKYYRAFDFVISACGYNSFHELIRYGIPTIFVPIELSFLDKQLVRANFAAEHFLGLCVRLSELKCLEEAVCRILNPHVREGMRRSCSSHRFANGADAAAGIISGFLR